MKERLKRRYDCSEEQLDKLLAEIDTKKIEGKQTGRVEIRIIDPPIINNIDVRNHPNKAQRELYTRQLKSGGKLSGIYVDGKMQSHAMLPGGNREIVKKATIERLVISEISGLLDVYFTDYGRKKILKTDKRAKK